MYSNLQTLRWHTFEGMSPMVLPFVRIIRLGLANNIIKMSSIKLQWLSLNMCLNKYCYINDFFLKIIPVAFFWNYSIKSDRQFYQGTLTFQVKHPRFHQQTAVCTYCKWTDFEVETMIYFVLFLANWTRKRISFCHIHAHYTAFTVTFSPKPDNFAITAFPKVRPWNKG